MPRTPSSGKLQSGIASYTASSSAATIQHAAAVSPSRTGAPGAAASDSTPPSANGYIKVRAITPRSVRVSALRSVSPSRFLKGMPIAPGLYRHSGRP